MDPILDRVADLRASISGQVVLRWGIVTSLEPFRVKLDADTDPLPFKPDRTVSGLELGDRVLAAVQNRRVTVIGRGGGVPSPEPGTQPEIDSGTDTTRYVTPKTMRDAAYRAFAEAAGQVTTSTGGAVAVTLPASRFTQAPRVVCEVVMHSNVCVTHTRNIGPSVFYVTAYTISGGIVAAVVDWHAMQMTAANASG